MNFSIAALLFHLSDNKLIAPKVLEKRLGCQDDEDIQKLHIALDALERIGVLVKERGKYRQVPDQDLVEAKLRCSSKGFCFAIQNLEDAEDIYVRESHLGSAWNGDRVLVKVIKQGTRRRSPEGEVQVILERSNPSLLARVKHTDQGVKAVPLDDRLLFELDLQQNGEKLDEAVDHLVHVEVLRYPLGSYPPIGRVTRILGANAEDAADTDIVCCKHDLPRTFPEPVLEAAKALPKKVRKTEINQRRDLRELLTLTIEGNPESANSEFVENAFTLEKTEAGQWQLGIHIADIAHYIAPDSPLDEEAKRRGTGIYLGDTILPLFPETVAHHCALQPGQESLTISLFLTLDETGQVVEFEIQPTVIQVDHQLSYQEAQSLLGRSNDVESDRAAAVEKLNQLFFTVAPLVKSQRIQQGGFEIDLSEAHLPNKDEGRLGAITVSSSLPVLSLLTELVVLAGKAVASHIQALSLPGIYRIQPAPEFTEIEDLLRLGNNLGLDIELESEQEIRPQDYQNITQQFAQSSAPKVLTHLLKSTLKPVRYSHQPGFHFGLAEREGYTPCVSPGRRYADLLVQRVLKAIFESGRDRRHSRAKEGVNLGSSSSHGKINWKVLPSQVYSHLETQLSSVISHLNEREKLAIDAETDQEGLQKAEQMKERTGQVFQGLITGVQSYGFFVEIEELLVEGLVHVSSLKDDWYEYRSRHACLVGRKNRIAYRLGSRVKVQVKSVDYYRQQIDLVTVSDDASVNNEELNVEG